MHVNKIKQIMQARDTGEACIIIGNSYCDLSGFSPEALEIIRLVLTYDNLEVLQAIQQTRMQISMAARFRKFGKIAWLKKQITRLEAEVAVCWLRENRFPTGHLTLVREALDAKRFIYTLEDVRLNEAPKVDYKLSRDLPTPRYFQSDMVKIGCSQHRGVFESAVGSGKTYVAQLLVHALKVPALIVLPSKDLATQTYDEFCEAFGASTCQLVNGVATSKTKKPVRICTIHTLTALRKKDALGTLLKGLGMICIDEVHHSGAKSYGDLLPYFDHIYYRFGFSGTFMRNDSRSLDMWGFLSTVLYRYSAGQATREGFLTPLKVITHTVRGVRASNYQTEYSRNYCENIELLRAINKILEENVLKKDQVLILVGRKEKSGAVIHEYLNQLGISNEYVSGDSKKDCVRSALLKFNSKKIKVLIGSSIIGEGINIRSTDHLIMAQGGKSEIAVTQAVGRAVRLFAGKEVAYVHDFRFSGTKYLEKHLEKRLNIYEKNFEGEILCTE